MKRSILKHLTLYLLMGTPVVPCYGQTYVLQSVNVDTSENYLDSTQSVTHGNEFITVQDKNNNMTLISFAASPLNQDRKEYNLQWLDGTHTMNYPVSCRTPAGTATSSSVEYIALDASMNTVASGQSVTDAGTINETNGAFHLEPVNKTAAYTRVKYQLPTTVECDGNLGEFMGWVLGSYRAQKWNDGNYPQWRRTIQAIYLTYTPKSSISAEFTPPTISMTGPVNSDLLHVASLVITTSGGTTVEIEWPDVDLVEYEQDGVWMRSHLQSISVADGVNQIAKCIRVRSSMAGSTTISVPVTMTIS